MQLGSYFDKVPHAYLADVFLIYDSNEVLKSLDGKIRDLAFGPDVHDPTMSAMVCGVSRMIMEQQLNWGIEAIQAYCRFHKEWAPELYAERQDDRRQDIPSFREACADSSAPTDANSQLMQVRIQYRLVLCGAY